MRFVIRHEGKNRLRVHTKQSRMTYEQADVLLYYLESMGGVVRAQVYSQTADAVICYGKGTDRASVLQALQKFAYQNVEVPVLDATGTGCYGNFRIDVAWRYRHRRFCNVPA